MKNVLVPLVQGTGNGHVFLFHASDGGVASYLTFAEALDAQAWGLQAPDSITANSLRALATGYLDVMESALGAEPVTLVGWSYGAAVAAEVARLLHGRDKAVRLVLIDPVNGKDFAVEDERALMRLLARDQAFVLPEDWDTLDETARIEAFVTAAGAAGVIPMPMSTDTARQWLSRTHQLLVLLANHQVGDSIPVPTLWIEADQYPGRWTPAVREWAAWKAQAQVHVVKATHWQLMGDSRITTHIAELVRQWLTQVDCQETAP